MNDNSLSNYLDVAGNATANILGALNKKKDQTVIQPQAPSPDKTPWGWIAGIGGAVLLVVILVVVGGRK